jgi:hypothetical protein
LDNNFERFVEIELALSFQIVRVLGEVFQDLLIDLVFGGQRQIVFRGCLVELFLCFVDS